MGKFHSSISVMMLERSKLDVLYLLSVWLHEMALLHLLSSLKSVDMELLFALKVLIVVIDGLVDLSSIGSVDGGLSVSHGLLSWTIDHEELLSSDIGHQVNCLT